MSGINPSRQLYCFHPADTFLRATFGSPSAYQSSSAWNAGMQGAKNGRVLIVEDQDLVRLVLVDVRDDSGFEVIAAFCGDEALALLMTLEDLDLLITDIQMPGQADGNAIGAVVRDRWPELPIIYMTGLPSSLRTPLRDRNALMTKPFTPGELLQVACRLVGLPARPDNTGAPHSCSADPMKVWPG